MNFPAIPTGASAWDAMIGDGFAQALQEGLSRATLKTSAKSTTARTTAPPAVTPPAVPPAALVPTGVTPPAPAATRPPEPPPGFSDAVLRRFEAALPDAVGQVLRRESAMLRNVLRRARALLATALTIPAELPGPEQAGDPLPQYRTAASVLLLECVVLEMLESGHSDPDAVRALSATIRANEAAEAAPRPAPTRAERLRTPGSLRKPAAA
ncbi:hypothetical protein ACIQK6_22815 [Streptomyces sp. NPDC091682]|uniref:hypothetical protein n=1 Tax=Streptomyces sp. NPDC091682 TaxID=3366005 RepID=UPI0038293937